MFEDIVGYENIKKEIIQIINWYKSEELFGDNNVLPKGIVFCGEPGNGKTLFLKSIKEEFDENSFVIKGDKEDAIEEIIDVYKKAHLKKYAVVIIDEIDLLIDKDSRVIRILQDLLDGIYTKGGRVLTIVSTNNIYAMPESLLRNGRFDRRLEICNPKSEERKQIILNEFKKFNLSISSQNIDYLTYATDLFSCARIVKICSDIYLRNQGKQITIKEIVESIEIVTGMADFCNYNNMDDKRRFQMAIHEIGHALIINKYSDSFQLISVNLYSNQGICYMCPVHDIESVKEQIIQLEISLAGVIAEKLFYKYILSGTVRDLREARENANFLVNRYGIPKVSNILKRYSYTERMETEKSRYINEKESNKLLLKSEREVFKFLKCRKKDILKYAKMLVDKDFLTKEDFM